MRKLVVGFIFLLSLPLASTAEEQPAVAPAAAPDADQPAVVAPAAPAATPAATPDVAQPADVTPATPAITPPAPPAAAPTAYPPGYLPWKAPQSK